MPGTPDRLAILSSESLQAKFCHHSVYVVERECGALRIEHRLQRTSPVGVRDGGPIGLQATAGTRGRKGTTDAVVPIPDGAACVEGECLDVRNHPQLSPGCTSQGRAVPKPTFNRNGLPWATGA